MIVVVIVKMHVPSSTARALPPTGLSPPSGGASPHAIEVLLLVFGAPPTYYGATAVIILMGVVRAIAITSQQISGKNSESK